MKNVAEISDAIVTGMILAGDTVPDYYWIWHNNQGNKVPHNIPLIYVGKKSYYLEPRKEFTEYFLKVSYRGYARSKEKYIEWPYVAYMSPQYINKWGVIVAHENETWYDHRWENNEMEYDLRKGNPFTEYVIVETNTGKAKYMKALPNDPKKMLLWKLVECEGTIK
jgi:hypothetical protein